MQAFDPATTVHVGRDGWLFLIGGTNSVLTQYRRLSWHFLRIRSWARLIRQRNARAQALGIRYVQTMVPEKLSIYDDRTAGLRYDPARSPARRLARHLMGLPGFVDLVAPLRAARDEAELYRRTDTHWTYDGCHIAYRALMRACGAVPLSDFASRPRFTTGGVWDLGEKLPSQPVETVTHWTLDRHAVRAWASPRVEAYEAAGRIAEVHVGAHVIYRNAAPEADPRTVMLFGDSCAQFTRTLLTGFLAESFAELHFIWSSSIDWTHVERVRPDILMVEMAERFMARVPVDEFDVEAADLPPADGLVPREAVAAE
jgi:alginate O-acetyltransferase complex protein AlgJ